MKACPKCKTGSVELNPVAAAKPLGSYSVTGAQTKIVATLRWVATCTACSLHVVGHLEDAKMNEEGIFVGGHFVEDRY